MMCYYLNVHFQGQRVKPQVRPGLTNAGTFIVRTKFQRSLRRIRHIFQRKWKHKLFVTEVFPCFFLSCRANARVKPSKMGHGPHSSIFVLFYVLIDRLCGLVIRVSGYRCRGLGFDSRRYQIFWVVVGLERGPLNLVRSIEELLE